MAVGYKTPEQAKIVSERLATQMAEYKRTGKVPQPSNEQYAKEKAAGTVKQTSDAQNFEAVAKSYHRQPVAPVRLIAQDDVVPIVPTTKQEPKLGKVGANPMKPGSLAHTKPSGSPLDRAMAYSKWANSEQGSKGKRDAAKDASPLAPVSSAVSSVRSGVSSLHAAMQTGASIGRKVAEGTVVGDAVPGQRSAPHMVKYTHEGQSKQFVTHATSSQEATTSARARIKQQHPEGKTSIISVKPHTED